MCCCFRERKKFIGEKQLFLFPKMSLRIIWQLAGVKLLALREALTNALCHRQLEKYNLTIGIAIYDDRIEIENPGFLPPQITPETIRNSRLSMPYNPIMADVLFKTTFLENWGTGLNRIVEACVKQNLPEPEWRMQQGFVIVTFKRPPYGAEPGTCPPSTPQVPNKYRTSTFGGF